MFPAPKNNLKKKKKHGLPSSIVISTETVPYKEKQVQF